MPERRRKKKKQSRKTSAEKLAFFVEEMDALGQGVSKKNGRITFIPKTLPGESGTASLQSRKKGVQFATLEQLDEPAANRITPECPHFFECPGCDYLHTDYDSELAYKKAALEHQLHAFKLPEYGIEVVAAPERLGYRNRVQLHYRHRYLGMLDGAHDRVLEIPDCRLPEPALQKAMAELYRDKSRVSERGGQGHCELSLVDGAVQTAWNQAYAQAGFTQVNSAMNDKLKKAVADVILADKPPSLLDLFAGSGNLSDDIAEAGIERVMVDVGDYDDKAFIRQDLYADDALARVRKQVFQKDFQALLLDPPRRGFAALAGWARAFRVQHLVYVSCNAATMARDLKLLQQGQTLKIERVVLLDMFPATRHFETMASVRLS